MQGLAELLRSDVAHHAHTVVGAVCVLEHALHLSIWTAELLRFWRTYQTGQHNCVYCGDDSKSNGKFLLRSRRAVSVSNEQLPNEMLQVPRYQNSRIRTEMKSKLEPTVQETGSVDDIRETNYLWSMDSAFGS